MSGLVVAIEEIVRDIRQDDSDVESSFEQIRRSKFRRYLVIFGEMSIVQQWIALRRLYADVRALRLQ
jgi:hypothetical protein